MRHVASSVLLLAFLLLGCQDQPAPVTPTQAPAAQPATGATTASSPAAQAPTAPAEATPKAASASRPSASAPAPVVSPSPAQPAAGPSLPAAQAVPSPPPAQAPTSVAAPSPVAAPASAPTGPVTLAANGHAAIGADKCRMCHRLQHDSWSATAHAKKGLDCEACHGNGADYKAMSVMKNPAAAKAAGLVVPTLEFCRKCHGAKADAAMLRRAHAHKGA